MGMVHEFVDHIKDIRTDKISPGHVDEDKGILGQRLELLFYDRFVEETHVFPETKQVFIAVVYDHHGRVEIASQQEEKRDTGPDEDTDQQIGQQDGCDRRYKGGELVPAFTMEFPEQGGLGQFITRHYQDGGHV